MRDSWYLGTADAVYQNVHSIEDEGLPYALVLSADHVYKMNYRHMLKWHLAHQADVTLATTLVPPSEAGRFGIVNMTDDFQIMQFEEKPKDSPARSRFDPKACSAEASYAEDARCHRLEQYLSLGREVSLRSAAV
jgi:glucose-1-phosphate adenylyltransferase